MNDPIATFPFPVTERDEQEQAKQQSAQPLTIAAAKRGLAETYGVPETAVLITTNA